MQSSPKLERSHTQNHASADRLHIPYEETLGSTTLMNVVIQLAQIKDTLFVYKELLSAEEFAKSPNIKTLLEINAILSEEIAKQVIKAHVAQLSDIATRLTPYYGNAQAMLQPIILDAKFARVIRTRLHNIVAKANIADHVDNQLSMLVKVNLPHHKKMFFEAAENLGVDKKQDKEASAAVTAILAELNNTTDSVLDIDLELPTPFHYSEIKKLFSQLNEEFPQHKPIMEGLTGAFYASHEAFRLNSSIKKHQLSDHDVEHLKILFTDYFNKTQNTNSPQIARVLMYAPLIQPIFLFHFNSIALLLDKRIAHLSQYFMNVYRDTTHPVYKTYFAIASATTAFLDITTTLDNIEKQKQKEYDDKKTPQEVKLALDAEIQAIRRYKNIFANFFQLNTRFVMPIKETQKRLMDTLEKLEKSQEKVEKEEGEKEKEVGKEKEGEKEVTKKGDEEIEEKNAPKMRLKALLEQTIAEFNSPIDFFEQKPASINIAKLIDDLQKKILAYFNDKKAPLLSWLSQPSLNPNEQILVALGNYFGQITQSAQIENSGNLSEVLDKACVIMAEHQFNSMSKRTQKKAMKNPAIKLILEIEDELIQKLAFSHQASLMDYLTPSPKPGQH